MLVGGFLNAGALIGAATVLHSDDGLHALAGVLYGMPVVAFLTGVIAVSSPHTRPFLDGLIAAEGAALLGCLATAVWMAAPAFAGMAFVWSQLQAFPFGTLPTWAGGALGGWVGARVTSSLERL